MGNEMIIKVGSAIKEKEPHLIIVNEIFSAPPLAKIFEIPILLIMRWFYESISPKHPFNSFCKERDACKF